MLETARDEITRLEQQYEKDPEGRLFVHLAEAYRKSGELKRARELLQQRLDQHRDSVSARIVLAQVHGAMGNAEAARAVWREVVERDEENELALRALASLEDAAGNGAEALGYYRQLQKLGVEDDEVAARIAELSPGGERRTDAERPAAVQLERMAVSTLEHSRRPAAAGVQTHTDAVGLGGLLVRLLECRNSTFRADSSLTRVLSLAMGREMELEGVHLDALALAALLSDLGSLALPDHAPARPYASEELERAAEQRKVAISLQLLQDIALPAGVHEAIRHQHEWWDGSGHPHGLREEEIPRNRARAGGGARLRRAAHRHGRYAQPQRARGAGRAPATGRLPVRARGRLRDASGEVLVIGANLPTHDVARFIREVRDSPTLGGIPVVVIDANEVDLRVEMLTAGADVCFPGDTSFREFKATLDALLRRREENAGIGA